MSHASLRAFRVQHQFEQEVEELRSVVSKANEEKAQLMRENESLRSKVISNADDNDGLRMMQDTNEFLRGELEAKQRELDRLQALHSDRTDLKEMREKIISVKSEFEQ